MTKKSERRTSTLAGLGEIGLKAVRHVSMRLAPTSGFRDRTEAAPSSSRRPRAQRHALRVDEVGSVAVMIAAKTVWPSAPVLLKTRAELTHAPLDHRDAFVISLIDGKLSVPALVDVSGMAANEITDILTRLAHLGIISLP